MKVDLAISCRVEEEREKVGVHVMKTCTENEKQIIGTRRGEKRT